MLQNVLLPGLEALGVQSNNLCFQQDGHIARATRLSTEVNLSLFLLLILRAGDISLPACLSELTVPGLFPMGALGRRQIQESPTHNTGTVACRSVWICDRKSRAVAPSLWHVCEYFKTMFGKWRIFSIQSKKQAINRLLYTQSWCISFPAFLVV
jgi:hypothetical protein